MSRKTPIKINLKASYEVNPKDAFIGRVVKSGNGAVITSFKRYIGKEVIVIVAEDKVKEAKKETQKALDAEVEDLTALSLGN